MLEIQTTSLQGCYLLKPFIAEDARGSFVKVFNHDAFKEKGLCSRFDEQFYSVSRRGVIRGMHFQVPPSDLCKTVYCLAGSAHDVVLDLRKASPSFGRIAIFELAASDPAIVYIPRGMAHGFLARADDTVLVYNVEKAYDPACDTGLRWDSFGYRWPVDDPILSERDFGLTPFEAFDSPFLEIE